MRRGVLLAITLLMVTTMTGCLGGDARSEWAYDITQIDTLAGRGLEGAGIRIGVLDTGIDPEHPSMDHLVDKDPGNGELMGFQDYIRQRFGVDAAYDDLGHGTHVVGIMAASGSSFGDKLLYGGVDLRGASPRAAYYVAKVCDADNCPAPAIADALEWMGEVDVDVVSLSLGGERSGGIVINDEIRNSINQLIDRGTVVVASAGNDGTDGDDVNAPADIQGVIAVGAIDEDGRVADISSRGDNDGFNSCRSVPISGQVGRCDPHKKPEIVAPGVNILSAWIDKGYARATGTSQAAPFVTSAVALMLEGETKPSTREQVTCIKDILRRSAMPVEGQTRPHDDAAGYGILRAAAADGMYDCT